MKLKEREFKQSKTNNHFATNEFKPIRRWTVSARGTSREIRKTNQGNTYVVNTVEKRRFCIALLFMHIFNGRFLDQFRCKSFFPSVYRKRGCITWPEIWSSHMHAHFSPQGRTLRSSIEWNSFTNFKNDFFFPYTESTSPHKVETTLKGIRNAFYSTFSPRSPSWKAG